MELAVVADGRLRSIEGPRRLVRLILIGLICTACLACRAPDGVSPQVDERPALESPETTTQSPPADDDSRSHQEQPSDESLGVPVLEPPSEAPPGEESDTVPSDVTGQDQNGEVLLLAGVFLTLLAAAIGLVAATQLSNLRLPFRSMNRNLQRPPTRASQANVVAPGRTATQGHDGRHRRTSDLPTVFVVEDHHAIGEVAVVVTPLDPEGYVLSSMGTLHLATTRNDAVVEPGQVVPLTGPSLPEASRG